MIYSEPVSYWQATMPPVPPAGDDLPATAEVAVIGGGVLGAATALWLARAGIRPVLLEREGPAAGASGRNGGLVVPGTAEAYPAAIARHGHATARAIWALTVEGLALLDQLLAEEQLDCDHRLVGHLSLALDDAQLAAGRRVVEALRADGFAAEWLEREAVQAMIATPLGPTIRGAKLLPEARAVHSGRFVRALLEAARNHGARLCFGVEVIGISAEGAGLRLQTSRGVLRAGAGLSAVNGWSSRLSPTAARLITPVRGQALAYAPLPPVFQSALGASLTPTGEYWQQTRDGSIVIGGCRALAPGRDTAVTAIDTTPDVQAGIETILPQLFPGLGPLRVAHRWGGTMGFSPDYLPLAGRPGDMPFWFAGGFSGHGMPFALPLGRLLAEATMSGITPPGLALFDPARLGNSTAGRP